VATYLWGTEDVKKKLRSSNHREFNSIPVALVILSFFADRGNE